MRPPASLWMLQTTLWEPCWSSKLTRSGAVSRTFCRSCAWLRSTAVLNRELLAAYLAIRHFQHFVESRKFHVLTNPLLLLSPSSLATIQATKRGTWTILPNSPQTSGVEVDMLHTMSSIIDFKAMADAQSNDPPLEGGAQSITVSWILIPTCDATLLCDTPTGTPHPLVPPQFCRKVFDALHSLSHPGVQATQRFVTSRYVWPGINKDIQDWMQTCLQCQRVKVH